MDRSVQANSRRLFKRLALVENMMIFLRYNYPRLPQKHFKNKKNIFN